MTEERREPVIVPLAGGPVGAKLESLLHADGVNVTVNHPTNEVLCRYLIDKARATADDYFREKVKAIRGNGAEEKSRLWRPNG